jgi:hypothetical protein
MARTLIVPIYLLQSTFVELVLQCHVVTFVFSASFFWQICPPDNDTEVCLPSQGVKNDPTLSESDNQCGLRSCVVKDRDTCEESVLDYFHNNQEISSQTEAMVHDFLDKRHKCPTLN